MRKPIYLSKLEVYTVKKTVKHFGTQWNFPPHINF